MFQGHPGHGVLKNLPHHFDELGVELGHGRSSRYGRQPAGSAILCLHFQGPRRRSSQQFEMAPQAARHGIRNFMAGPLLLDWTGRTDGDRRERVNRLTGLLVQCPFDEHGALGLCP